MDHELRNVSSVTQGMGNGSLQFRIGDDYIDELQREATYLLGADANDEKDDTGKVVGKINRIDDVIKAPKMFEFGLNSGFIEHLEAKHKCKFVYRGFAVRTALASDFDSAGFLGTMCWHLDPEDPMVTKAPVYLSDVEMDHGPFEYLDSVNGMLSRLKQGSRVVKARNLRLFGEPQLNSLVGEAGTGALVQTGKYWHRGRPARRKGRTVIFYCYNPVHPRRPDYCSPLFPETMKQHISSSSFDAFDENSARLMSYSTTDR